MLELFSLGFGIFAVVKDYHKLQGPVITFLAIATSTILPLISRECGANACARRWNTSCMSVV